VTLSRPGVNALVFISLLPPRRRDQLARARLHCSLRGDLQAGITLTWRGVRLSHTHVLRTREFESQREHDECGSGTLSVSL
jgi:hypothetical protein